MRNWIANRRIRGLTLIEMAVVLVIFGVVAGGGMIGVARSAYKLKVDATQQSMNHALDALSAYAQHYNRLPCPSDPNANLGKERNNGQCIDNSNLLNMYTTTEGVLPWKELGIPESDARDGWGHYFTYKPAPALTVQTYSPNMQDLTGTGDTAHDVSDACRTVNWFALDKATGTLSFADRRKALFCCNTMPKPVYLTNDAGLGLGGNLPANWRTQAVIAGSTYQLPQHNNHEDDSLPAGTPVQDTNNWMDDPTGAANGPFSAPQIGAGAAVAPVVRATGDAVTLISHGGNGFLSFLHNKPVSTRDQATVTNIGVIPSAKMSSDEQLNVFPPQLAASTVYNPKTSGGGYDLFGLRAGASDDIAITLRSDQIMGRLGNSGCLHPANATKPLTMLNCPWNPAVLITDPACHIDGVCGPTQYACTKGLSVNHNDNGVLSTWDCNGQYGGSNAACSLNDPVNGLCNNTAQYACTKGVSANHNDNGVVSTWDCDGQYGGSDDTGCSHNDPIAGVCDNTTQYACLKGASANQQDKNQVSTWTCKGSGGPPPGNDDNCSKKDCLDDGFHCGTAMVGELCGDIWAYGDNCGEESPASPSCCGGSYTMHDPNQKIQNPHKCTPVPMDCGVRNDPIDGLCNTVKQYACLLGTDDVATNKDVNGVSTWTCDGVNGGSNDNCTLPDCMPDGTICAVTSDDKQGCPADTDNCDLCCSGRSYYADKISMCNAPSQNDPVFGTKCGADPNNCVSRGGICETTFECGKMNGTDIGQLDCAGPPTNDICCLVE